MKLRNGIALQNGYKITTFKSNILKISENPCTPAHIECSTTMDAASIARLEEMAYR